MYIPYSYQPQHIPSTSVGLVDNPPMPQAHSEPDTYHSPGYPPEPQASPPPRKKRTGRAAAILLLTLVLALIFGVSLFAGWEFAGSSRSSTSGSASTVSTTSTAQASANTIQAQQEAAIAKIEPAVVELKVTTAQGEQIGSGVILDTNGDIVTNFHVISGERTITVVLYNGNTEQAQLVGGDSANDVAVVRIAPFAHMTVAQLGDSSKLVVGQEVLAIGNPLGITETATRGIVSALNRSVTESTGATITHAIQTDAAVNPGNSGGALINLQGQLIGIPTLGVINTSSNSVADGLSFAIPANLVATVAHQLIQQGNQ